MNDLKKLDPYEIRKDFPIFERKIRGKPLIYLDNAATTQKPRSVIESEKRFYEEINANIHRAVYTLSYEATVLYEEAHKKVADFIGAKSWREIVFTRNATESINLVAYGWGLRRLKEGDEVLLTIMEHHSNIVPWQMLRDLKGIVLRFLDVDSEGRLDLDKLHNLLSERTKLVSIIHASNVLGVINPLKYIINEAKKVGALVLVDAAQSIPHIPIDVSDLGCDFLVASGHKMLGPTGIGFLYGRSELLDSMDPFLYGGDMIETVTLDKATWNELPWKFEAGTPNIAGGIGLGVAIDYLNKIGLRNIAYMEKELLDYAFARFSDLPWIEVYGPKDDERIGVISFNIKGIHPHDIAGVLDEEGIAVRSGHHCAQPLMRRLGMDNAVRVSFYLYNTKEEVDRLVDVLREVKRVFGV
ncbi:MAG: cysteine desulfurase [Deltaproteobacteria bacterium]|jgi:cysteine desulfurase/selenocysteine lyase|nr:MAG: cysteine desulfurase [Deltaproteobacteria bacterium]